MWPSVHSNVKDDTPRYRAVKLWRGREGDSYKESGLDRLCVCAHSEGVLQRQHMCLERERGNICHGGHGEVVCEKYIR